MEFIDTFCGAGGTTSGIEQAEDNGVKIAHVIACINHDPIAIASHYANHPYAKHFVEDIRDFDLKKFPKFVRRDNVITALWASLECTNHSNAKGGLSRDADSRTLGWDFIRYIDYLKTDVIMIENVREFLDWGPLIPKVILTKEGYPVSLLHFSKKDKKLKAVMVPDKNRKGEEFEKWIKTIESFGYKSEHRILNAADFGEPTSRRRLFIIFAKEGIPITWPEPTHDKFGRNGLKKWVPVKTVLDFEDKGKSIFAYPPCKDSSYTDWQGRNKWLSDKTYERIYKGLVKYVANGDTSFLTKWLGNNSITGVNSGKSVNDTCPTVTCQNRLGLVNVNFLVNYSGNANSTELPSPTVLTHDHTGIVQPDFLIKYHGSGNNILSVDDSCSTITCKDRLGFVQAQQFLDLQYSHGKQSQSIEEPSGAILPVPKQKLVSVETAHFINEQYGCSTGKSIEEPAGAIVNNPKQNLVSVEHGTWIMDTNFNNTGSSVDDPSRVITASRRQFYLMNPQWASEGGSIDDPCFTLIARMDKMPPYLVEVERGNYAIEIYDTDLPIVVKIKQFMAAYGIIDVKMRMLKKTELLPIQGFPKDYVLFGNQSDQKKFIGNAVPPAMPKAMTESMYGGIKKLREELQKVAA